MTHHIDLNRLVLTCGGHNTRSQGTSLLEAVAWFADEPHSDHPACVSPVLADYGRRLNDVLPDDKRQQLRPHIPRLAGTAGDGLDEIRSWTALDWLVRTYAPAWLDLAGLSEEARELRELRRIADLAAALAAAPVVRAGAEKACAAWVAAWVAAWDAAWVAAWAAAWDAAGAVGVAIKPTIDQLQDSAITLLGHMINPIAA